ncbi:MAG: CPBP family intramembrane metalloprotease [Kiritimatiellae bacterium]|nr:CPBP family intramembrane metalloprotease [Kiritimatiellia bacterium]
MHNVPVTRRPLFWVVLAAFSCAAAWFGLTYFPVAFPIVTLDLRMDRAMALARARELARRHEWQPAAFEQAASFGLDSTVRNFVELEAGGRAAFRQMLKAGLYVPYTWQVRHFREGEARETTVRFTPAGAPYGFEMKLPEDEPGAALEPDQARPIAEQAARRAWGLDLTEYEEVETSKEIRKSGRVDHTFVYERPDARLGEGRYRLRLGVQGDRFTGLSHFVKIPEGFLRRYKEMRALNRTLGGVAGIVAWALFWGGGCLVGLVILMRRRWVLWRRALLWSAIVAGAQLLARVNMLPLAWLDYDTATSAHGFLLEQLAQLLAGLLSHVFALGLIFAAAESLTRKAFPRQIQLWRVWAPGVGNSRPVLGRTLGGYAATAFHLAFVVGFYLLAANLFGWWQPSSALVEPDVLAAYLPWLAPLAAALQAGFMEECLFRAIPLAGAALIGSRFGRRRAWIAGAFVLQAVVFGAAHATYEAQPCYARLVELIVPSCVFAGLYLTFGLLPAVISHFAVDALLMASPLFVSSAAGVWVDKSLVVLLTLVPLWVVLYRRGRARQWAAVPSAAYNGAWQPAAGCEGAMAAQDVAETRPIGPILSNRLVVFGWAAGLAIVLLASDFTRLAPRLSISRRAARALARDTLRQRGIDLPAPWRLLSTAEDASGQPHRFVWHEGGPQAYSRLIGTYLAPPAWKMKFARFEGDVARRAEEYVVHICADGEILSVQHKLPEAAAGAALDEEEARALTRSAVQTRYGLDPDSLKEILAEPFKLPARRDWKFRFADPHRYPLESGEARITVKIAGDEVAAVYRYVHVPEEWDRQERSRENVVMIARLFSGVAVTALVLAGIVGAIIRWARRKLSVRLFLLAGALLLLLRIANMVNDWPATVARFSTSEPLSTQVLLTVLGGGVGALFSALGTALLVAAVPNWKRTQVPIQTRRAVLLGGGIGLLLPAAWTLVSSVFPPLTPVLGDFGPADSYCPLLRIALGTLQEYVGTLAFLILVIAAVDRFSDGWRRHKPLFAGVLLVFAMGALSADESLSIVRWALNGLVGGVLLILASRYVFRFHLALFPFAGLSAVGVHAFTLAVLDPYPAALPGALLAVALCTPVALFWFNQLNRTAPQPPPAPPAGLPATSPAVDGAPPA